MYLTNSIMLTATTGTNTGRSALLHPPVSMVSAPGNLLVGPVTTAGGVSHPATAATESTISKADKKSMARPLW